MRNFKDLSRALASIAGGLKGIKDIIDTIEPGGGGVGGIDYSTTEQDTGLKWIDGSAVYQQTFTGTTPNANTGSVNLPEGTRGQVISIEGIAGPNNIDSNLPLPSKNGMIYISTTATEGSPYGYIYFDVSGDSTFKNVPFELTVRYLKPSE